MERQGPARWAAELAEPRRLQALAQVVGPAGFAAAQVRDQRHQLAPASGGRRRGLERFERAAVVEQPSHADRPHARHQPRIDRGPLSALPRTDLRLQTTLVLPPAWPMQRDEAVLARLAALDAALARAVAGEGEETKSVLLPESPRSD